MANGTRILVYSESAAKADIPKTFLLPGQAARGQKVYAVAGSGVLALSFGACVFDRLEQAFVHIQISTFRLARGRANVTGISRAHPGTR
jgi:hypothetical protein